MQINPPKEILNIYNVLTSNGYECYLVGGCVRDSLLGNQPKDWDLVTSALPNEVESLFDNTLALGKAFGIITVIINSIPIDVATFRGDVGIVDGRHPQKVFFTNALNDVLRRDFTVNALFYDCKNDMIVDYVDGIADLNNKIIRAVGEPDLRFREDYLRMLRAVRFATVLNFEIEEQTLLGIQNNAENILSLSKERIASELHKIWTSSYLPKGICILIKTNLLVNLFPFLQNDYCQYLQQLANIIDERMQNCDKLRLTIEEQDIACWSLIFCRLEKDKVKYFLEYYRQSRELSRSVFNVLELLSEIMNYDNLRLAEQRLLVRNDCFKIAMAIYIVLNNNVCNNDDIMKLWEKEQNINIVQPLVDGKLLRSLGIPAGSHYQEIIKSLYYLQLEEKIVDIDDAIDVIKEKYTNLLTINRA